MQLNFIRCYSCGQLLEMNKLQAAEKTNCPCGSRHFIGANPSKLAQLIYVLVRPFYWPHLFKGE